MFQSSNYFKQVTCPFFKHDLCHRPYCHFKHSKSRKDKEKSNTENVDSTSESSKGNKSRPRSPEIEEINEDIMNIVKNRPRSPPIEEVNQDIMNIVKNISPSKLIEYAKRKQEVQELQQALAQVDKETRETLDNPPSINMEDELKKGLIDSFYSKAKVPVNIISGDIVDSAKDTTKPSLNDISEGLCLKKERRICNCDDPDCSGFIEDGMGANHIDGTTPMNVDDKESGEVCTDMNTNDDDAYMRRKLQRRLDRKKKILSQTKTFTSEFPKTPGDTRNANMPSAGNGVDEDVSSYIEKCKEEYKRKKEEERLLLEQKDILLGNTNITEINTNIPEINEKDFFIVNGQNLTSNISKSEELPINKKNKIKKDREKKVNLLSDIDFFGNKIPENNMNFPEIDDNESFVANEQNLNSNSPTEEKHCDGDTIKKTHCDGDTIKKKPKKKRTNSSSDEKCSKRIKKKRNNSTSTSEKQCDGDNVNKKSKKTRNNSLSTEENHTNGDNVNGGNIEETKGKKRKKVRRSLDDNHPDKDSHENDDADKNKKVTKKKKVKLSREKLNSIKMEENCLEQKLKNNALTKSQHSSNLGLKNGNVSCKIVENNIQKKSSCVNKELSSEKNNLKRRKHADSEGSDASRNAFDIIAISSSDDDKNDDGNDNDDIYDFHESVSADDSGDSPMDDYSDPHDNNNCSTSDFPASSKFPGEAKKRIGLSNEQIPRKSIQPSQRKTHKISYVSPGVAGTASVNKQINKSKPSPSPAITTSAVNKENYVSTGKKRIAHVNTHEPPDKDREEDKSKLDRPKLEIDIGGKVPHLIRQKYLDKMIDEIIPKVKTEKEAFEKSLADEADAYKRSNRKQIYMSICANIIKRIRSMPNYDTTLNEQAPLKEQPKAANPMKTAEPTVKSVPKRIQSLHNNAAAKHVKKEQPKAAASPMKTAEPTVKFVPRFKSATIAGYKKIEMKDNIPKKCIKPASTQIVNTAMEKQLLPRERKTSITLEPLELTENNFYEHMQQYLMTTEQLWDNKYPRRDPDNPEKTEIKEYVPSINAFKRVCCRCGKEYHMNKKGKYVTRDECHYHWGKQLKQRGRTASGMVYTCCGAGGDGLTCAMCRLHVSNKTGPLENYVSTENCDNMDSRKKVFALDCEMCYTTQGLELTRLTVVDFDLEQIIDLFVKPTNPIVDYNTRFSGVTKQHLQDVDMSINDIQDILLNMFDKDTILMGHSLESDLNALNIIHHKVVDTAIVFPHRMGLPVKRALRNLMVEYLQKVIQSEDSGHDSCEDARSCMELMRYKFKEDQKKRKRATSSSSRT